MHRHTPQATAVSPDAQIDVAAVDMRPRPRRPRGPTRAARDALSVGDGASGDDAPPDTPRLDTRKKRPRGPIRSTAHSLTESDAAQYLGVSRAYLRQGRARAQGSGPPYCRYGRAVRYRISDLNAFIAAHRIDPSARKRRA